MPDSADYAWSASTPLVRWIGWGLLRFARWLEDIAIPLAACPACGAPNCNAGKECDGVPF